MIICLPSCHSDLPKLASGASNVWWRNYLYNVTQLIKRHEVLGHFHRLPVQYSSQITVVTSPGHHHTLPQSPTLIKCLAVHILPRERAMPESVVLQGVTSSMLGSFCPDTYHIFSISSSKLYSAACICLINSKFPCHPRIPHSLL